MNILTIGLQEKFTEIFNQLVIETCNNLLHVYEKENALKIIKSGTNIWDWIIIQGHDNPEHWKSVLCAVNAHSNGTQITVLSSHLDGTKLKTPVCSMHKSDTDNEMVVSRCAMQSMLQEQPLTHLPNEDIEPVSPIVFEYHAPCR